MPENSRILPEVQTKPVPPVLYALVSNALQVYGILVLGWHFFPILYLWWWEELILSTFGVLKLRRLRTILRQHQTEIEIQEGERSARGRYFLLFVYFIFIVVLGGFVFAPQSSYIDHIITLIFRNQVFNLNLLLFIALQAWVYWRDFYPLPDLSKTDVKSLQSTMDVRSAIIHGGLLMGALASFICLKYALNATEHAFMFGFMFVKTVVELWVALRRK